MSFPRPNGRPKDDAVACPECDRQLTFNWDVVPPSDVELDARSDYGEALHPPDEGCEVARVAISRSDSTKVIPVEWYRRDGTTVSRTWEAPDR
jgi:hypothetical protein